ncbi:SpoIIE family protein phosphatase [Kitasatospora atroaurantiaca]|uniref:protein-serine/threonine phosphatase n=1 Tax=Kitasatospora atroaurantiaca TaxID=285545 RepID=A0A561EXM6_9ACTN|nr:SpoIIE family protein phosphatase [Kitasatospora atroaurantiaca]TWE20365.1 PAS domain S-box-containing protein [Kitasatospora atroaurantiaca]
MHDSMFNSALGDLVEPWDAAYATIDAHGVLTSWSPGAQRLLGYTADEVRGRRGADLLHTPADTARYVGRCRTAETTALGTAVVRHRDGSRVEVGLWVHPLVSTAGEPHWLIQAEDTEAIRQQDLGRALLRGLFTESPFHIDVFDTQLRFVAQNARRLRGFASKVLGLTMREVAPDGLLDLTAFEARQRQVLATGEALVATEVPSGHPDDPDHDKAWSETIVPLRSGSGEVIGLAHAVFDVTEKVRARERLALVNDASSRIGSTLDVLRTAQELTEFAVPVFADHAYVNLLEPVLGGEEPVAGPVAEAVPLRRAASSSVPGGPGGAAVVTGDVDPLTSGAGSLFARALASRELVLLTGEELLAELTAAWPDRAALAREHGVRSWLLVPMAARGAVLGAVVFVRFGGRRAFEADDELLAEEFVARAAVCIDNASRYTRERTTALALQRSLLPQHLPVLGAVEAAWRYLPASGHTVLGGDWFDVIPLSGARVALVVGDVTGHGLHSAVTMGRLRTAVRTLADLDLSPEELLTRLDEQVHRLQDGRREGLTGGAAGTTCVYALFDPITRRCVLARAGHPPPVRVSADGKVELLDLPCGPPLGLGGAPFESSEVTLTDGDLLVLYTDGLVESRDQSIDVGTERLREALSDPQVPSFPRPGDICAAVTRQLLPEHPQEDAALLVARVHALGPDRHVTWELASEPEVVGRARTLAARKLAEWGLEELEFTTELVVSELVTNAIRYGNPPITLRLIRDRSLICEVSDGSSTSPHVRRALDTDEGGRGLYMVAQLVQLWGTRYHARGKTIWAEQPLPAAEPQGTGAEARPSLG